MNFVFFLVKLSKAHNVFCETGNEIHAVQHAVLPILVGEDDGATSFNVNDRAIAKPYCAVGFSFKLGEGLAVAEHVVCSPCI